MATILDLRLKKVNKVYKEGELLTGVVVVESRGDLQHQGIILSLDGAVTLQLSAKSVGLFEAFYNSLKPIQLISYTLEIAKPGRLPSGKTEIPFEIPLKPKGNKTLYETYHGVFVNIQYSIKVDMKRSLLNKDLQKQFEFIVEYKNQDEKVKVKPVSFTITPETLTNIKEKQNVPKFKVKGKLTSSCICITTPLTGEPLCSLCQIENENSQANGILYNVLVVESCESQIKSIEIQLVRVETCGCAEGYAKDEIRCNDIKHYYTTATEIQNIQIADGDVCRGVPIPIYMVFPRLFTCPTLSTNNFKVEFEINIVIIFQDDHLVTENFPIKLTRFK